MNVELCHELDEYLNWIIGGEKQRSKYTQYNTLEDIHDVALIMEDGEAVACGSYKKYGPGTAEIKRVFTKADYRNRGYGKSIGSIGKGMVNVVFPVPFELRIMFTPCELGQRLIFI